MIRHAGPARRLIGKRNTRQGRTAFREKFGVARRRSVHAASNGIRCGRGVLRRFLETQREERAVNGFLVRHLAKENIQAVLLLVVAVDVILRDVELLAVEMEFPFFVVKEVARILEERLESHLAGDGGEGMGIVVEDFAVKGQDMRIGQGLENTARDAMTDAELVQATFHLLDHYRVFIQDGRDEGLWIGRCLVLRRGQQRRQSLVLQNEQIQDVAQMVNMRELGL